ncbi:MAG: right-handed parallel beta-helix repeat-containing protein [Bacteroidetes bacterium]|nr:right-handed parallel beta-helix repeat-containing protein [Bacteroidota bacterium]
MKKLFFLLFVLIPLLLTHADIGDEIDNCTSSPSFVWNGEIGGLYLPSEGAIKVLFIFAQFPDDNFAGNSSWYLGQAPANMNSWVDETWSSSPTQNSITDYFNVMSWDHTTNTAKLKFTGKSFSVVTPHTRQWYLDNHKQYGDINKEIIQQLDTDPTWSFAQFDNWHYNSNFSFTNSPDGIVEMVIVIWRNIANEFSTKHDKDSIYSALNMGRWGDLGGSNFTVDGGARTIKTGYGGGGGGATICDWYSADMFRFSIHEFSHYLLGDNTYHNGFGFWAMLSGYEPRSYMINSYERYRLGWGNIINLSNTGSNILNEPLTDFITTGKAYRIEIDASTNQYFYIENHQKISYWDKCSGDSYPDDKGIFIMRQDRGGSSNLQAADWMYMIPADGRYNWSVNQYVYPDYYPAGVPVFKKLEENHITGYDELQPIPFTYQGVPKSPFEVLFLEDPITGQSIEHTARNGFGHDAFRIGYKTEFYPWSNPNNQKANQSTTNIGIKVNSINGSTINIDIYRDCNEYNITRNATLAPGTWNINQNVTVNSGVSLTIQPGTNLVFTNGASLIVNGNLNISGTSASNVVLDFVSPSTSPINCIWAYAGSQINIDYAEIKNAALAIWASDAEVHIDHSNLHNMIKPVYFYNLLSNSYGSTIKNTYIKNSSYEGVWLRNSSTYLENNKITNNSGEGLRLSSYSDPVLLRNTIENNRNGITVQVNCTPALSGFNLIDGNTYYGIYANNYGIVLADQGFNTFQITNGYNVYLSFYSQTYASENYWGVYPPDVNKFYADGTSFLDYSTPLPSNPGSGSNLPKAGQQSDLHLAYNNIIEGNYSDAEKLFKKIINEKFNDKEARYALSGLAACYRKSKKDGFKKYLEDELKPKFNNTKNDLYMLYLELDSYYLTQEGKYNEALDNLKLIRDNYPLDSETRKELNFQEGVINLVYKDNAEGAKSIFDKIKNDYPDERTKFDVDILLAAYNNGGCSLLKNGNLKNNLDESFGRKEEVPVEYGLYQNYPNPFNPTTAIRYQLSADSYVTLKIYDELGREVKTLVNQYQDKGRYDINFNASNLASGIYFYQLHASTGSVQSFVSTKKMLLLK